MKPLPPYRIQHGVIRLSEGADGTTWPWPFEQERDVAWLARYSMGQLMQTDCYHLAGIANAYSTLITHPARSVRETLHVLARIYRTPQSQADE